MSTSKPAAQGGIHTRLIPREEVQSVAPWSPQSLDGGGLGSEAPEAAPAPVFDPLTRKASFAERAAEAVQPFGKAAPQFVPRQVQRSGEAPVAAKTPPRTRRPLVGGVPGEEPPEPPEPPPPPSSPSPEGESSAAEAEFEPSPDVDALLDEARKSGYQDGYRNGLAALESYKQTQEAQQAAFMNDRVGALAADFHQRLETLEQQLAGRIAGVALELARQVVRSEVEQRPEVVLTVAEEALGALLASARQVVVRLNPEDHVLTQDSLTELLQSRGARLLADPAISRGGCMVESDIAVVDARIEARWQQVAGAMGSQASWNEGHEHPFIPVDQEGLGLDTVRDMIEGDRP